MAKLTKADRTALLELAAQRFSRYAQSICDWWFAETDKEIQKILESYDSSALDAKLQDLIAAANQAAANLNTFLATDAKGHALGSIGRGHGQYIGYNEGGRQPHWQAFMNKHVVNTNSQPHVTVYGSHISFMPKDVLDRANEIVAKRAREQKIPTYDDIDEQWSKFTEDVLVASLAGDEVRGLLDSIPAFAPPKDSFRCPSCDGPINPVYDSSEQYKGALRCPNCRRHWRPVDGKLINDLM
jgi:hypothetical protein